MEELRSMILTRMYNELSTEQLQKLESTLDLCFYDFNIEKKSRELVVSEDGNEVMLKNFLGAKLLGGASKNTIKHYRHILETMLRDIGKPVKEINTNDLRYLLAKYQVENKSSNVYLNNLRTIYSSFFKWMEAEEYIPKNPVNRIPAFKTPKKHKEPFTDTEIEKLNNACDNVRDRALLEFLLSTGLRVSECADLNIEDIDFRRGELIVKRGKGDKERKGYISERAMYWLEKYLDQRTDNDNAVWVGKRGRLTKSGIEFLVTKIAEQAGVPNAHPHRFRHTLASKLVEREASLPVVQDILGHEGIDTTMVYVKVSKDDVKNTHKKLIE